MGRYLEAMIPLFLLRLSSKNLASVDESCLNQLLFKLLQNNDLLTFHLYLLANICSMLWNRRGTSICEDQLKAHILMGLSKAQSCDLVLDQIQCFQGTQTNFQTQAPLCLDGCCCQLQVSRSASAHFLPGC